MRFDYFKPSSVLAPYVKHYWFLEIDDTEGTITERVVPVDSIQLLFHYKNPFSETAAENRITQPRSCISGLSTDYADVCNRGDAGVIAVAFNAYGACNFFDFPMNDVEESIVNLADIDYGGINALEDAIFSASELSGKIAALETYLINRLKPINYCDLALVKEGISIIRKARGQVRASELARRLFCTEKTLERKFSAFIGKTPKQYIRIARFQEVLRSFSFDGKLTCKAYENGYFDQAHFIKDFKTMAGYTPKQFLSVYPCNTGYYT